VEDLTIIYYYADIGANFKFGMDAPRKSPDMAPEKFFRKGGVARVKMVKDTNFKFGTHACSQGKSPHDP